MTDKLPPRVSPGQAMRKAQVQTIAGAINGIMQSDVYYFAPNRETCVLTYALARDEAKRRGLQFQLAAGNLALFFPTLGRQLRFFSALTHPVADAIHSRGWFMRKRPPTPVLIVVDPGAR